MSLRYLSVARMHSARTIDITAGGMAKPVRWRTLTRAASAAASKACSSSSRVAMSQHHGDKGFRGPGVRA